MAKEKMIELQLIKPVTPGTPGAKGKISLKNLFKEYLDLLQVPHADECCGDPTPCPAISQDLGNAIECRDDGIYAASGPEDVILSAENGLTAAGGTVTLGGDLVQSTGIELNENTIYFSDGAGNDIEIAPGDLNFYNNTNLVGTITTDTDELLMEGNIRVDGNFLHTIKVDADQADYLILPEDSGTAFVKFLDGNVVDRNLTLPEAVPGLFYTFGYEGNGTVFVRVIPQAGDTILFGDPSANPSTSTTGIEANNLGCTITLCCLTAGYWHPLSQMGIWTAV